MELAGEVVAQAEPAEVRVSLGILPLIAAALPIVASIALPMLSAGKKKKAEKREQQAIVAAQAAEQQAAEAAAARRSAQIDSALGLAALAGAGFLAWKIISGGKRGRAKKRRRR